MAESSEPSESEARFGTRLAQIRRSLTSIRHSIERELPYGHIEDKILGLTDVLLSIEKIRIQLSHYVTDPDLTETALALRHLLQDENFLRIAASIRFREVAPRVKTFLTGEEASVEQATHALLDFVELTNSRPKPKQDLFSLNNLKKIVPAQKIAPAQFEIRGGRLALAKNKNKTSPDDASNVLAAKEALKAGGERILSQLEHSNCDKRLIENVHNLQDLFIYR